MAGAAIAAGACGAAPAERTVDPQPALAVLSSRGPACAPEPGPEPLPRAGALVDSARLVAGVRALRGADPDRDGHVLLSLGYDAWGVGYRRDILEYSTSGLVADSVWRLARVAERDQAETGTDWGVRLRVDVTDPVGLTVSRRLFCRPIARNPDLQAAMQAYSPTGVRVRRGAREQTVQVATYVSELGTVTATRVVRGELAGGLLEREIYLHLRQFLFRPASVDGDPTGAWIEIPVVIRMPR